MQSCCDQSIIIKLILNRYNFGRWSGNSMRMCLPYYYGFTLIRYYIIWKIMHRYWEINYYFCVSWFSVVFLHFRDEKHEENMIVLNALFLGYTLLKFQHIKIRISLLCMVNIKCVYAYGIFCLVKLICHGEPVKMERWSDNAAIKSICCSILQ